MPARYYSPALGRFLQADPSGFQGGLNLYAYAGNDPVNQADPTGLTPDGSQGYTVTVTESVPTFFMALFGVKSLTVSVSTWIMPNNNPAKMVILGSNNMGSFSYWYYQLENAQGRPLTGNGYAAAEHVVGQGGITSNDNYGDLDNGIFTDIVGWANMVNNVPQSVTLPATMNVDATSMQTFTARYEGRYYNLSTEFEHENKVVNGTAMNTVTPVVP
jgi:uncharacterized protein RhaS with RHS repeats